MPEMLEILEGFDTIRLEEMDAVKLLDRTEVKYSLHRTKLNNILASLKDEYRVLAIDGKRFCKYETHYFDTPDYKMYLQHHNGKLNRNKVRFRQYVDSGICYFEIKFKSNKGRTVKDRVKLKNQDISIDSDLEKLLQFKTDYTPEMLIESMLVNYDRVTLVHKDFKHRMTIDSCLHFKMGTEELSFPDLIIVEIKQERSEKSLFVSLMQSHYIPEFSISKYCLGVASLNKEVKINNFKSKLLHVKKICQNVA